MKGDQRCYPKYITILVISIHNGTNSPIWPNAYSRTSLFHSSNKCYMISVTYHVVVYRVTDSWNIKHIQTAYSHTKCCPENLSHSRYLLWVEAALSIPVVSLRMTGFGHGTEDMLSSNWPGKQTSSHDGTGSPDLRMFSQRGLSLRHANASKIFSSIFINIRHIKGWKPSIIIRIYFILTLESSQMLDQRWSSNKGCKLW